MISPTILANEHITDVRALVGEYSFRLTELPHTKISVKVWYTDADYGGDRYAYAISHHVHSPVQASPYGTSAPYAPSEEGAVRRAISDTLTFCQAAIEAGHTPDYSWLVPNERF